MMTLGGRANEKMNKNLVFGFVLLAICLFVDSSMAGKPKNLDRTLFKNTKRLKEWVNSTNVSHSANFYLFNVTKVGNLNAGEDEDIEGPTLSEVGPFKFREDRQITVIGYENPTEGEEVPIDPENGNYDMGYPDRVVVSIRKFYHYVGKEADLDQKITVLNTPLQVMYQALHSFRMVKRPLWDHLKSTVIDDILNKLPLFVEKTAREVLFGYSDETVEQIPKIREIFEQYGLELNMDEYIRNGKFSVITSRNGTSTVPLTVKTGAVYNSYDLKDRPGNVALKLVGQMHEIGYGHYVQNATTDLAEGQPHNPNWQVGCTRIEGTVLGIHAPKLSGTTKIYEIEMERPIELVEVPSEKKANEQKVKKFVWSKYNFEGREQDDSDSEGEDGGKKDMKRHLRCWSSASMWQLNLLESFNGNQRKSWFRMVTPTVFSYPHFLHGKSLREQFTGLKADRTIHESFIEVNEETGDLIYERKNLQINIDTSASNVARNTWPHFEHFFPLYWYSEESKLIETDACPKNL